MKRFAALAVVLVAFGGAACSDDADTKNAIEVVATDTSCTPAQKEFDAGKITFTVKNEGDKITELYVYGKDDKVVSEVENIGAGTSRNMTVDLKAGEYELACKPGMTGDGIRTRIEVEGEGGSQSAENAKADREVAIEATEYKFSGVDAINAKVGEMIEFKLENKGAEEHEFEVLKPDGDALGEVEGTAPGKSGEAYMTFSEAGTYTYQCILNGHDAKGMKGTFTVT